MFKRFLPLIILLGLIVIAFATGLDKYLTLDTLKNNRAALLSFVEANKIVAALLYMAAYIGVVALSLPVGTVMTLSGGFLFGVPLGVTLTVIGATLGAGALFLIARSAFGDVLRARAGPFMAKMSEGFSKDAFSYLLTLRLVPLFPFFAVNLVPALLGMKLIPYLVATGIGIVPGTTVFTAFGAGLGEVFDKGGEVSLKGVLSPTMIAALVGMGLLSLMPVVLRKLRERNL
jgi:uncharacterized membrane protein YdjX (TVP38/TMEM64 family)